MESSLLRFNTSTTALPLPAPSPFHAANLRFGFRRHFSFPPGKLSRSSWKTQTIVRRPIVASIQRTGINEDQNMANRVSFTLACVVGIIGCSFWLKREAIAAAPGGRGGGGNGGSSSQMEYIARPEVMYKKPYPISKANSNCKCRRVALQKPGAEVPAGSDEKADEENLLQKPTEVPGDKQDERNLVQNPNSQVHGDTPEEGKNIPNPDSKVPAAEKQEENPVQNPNSEGNHQTPNPGIVDSLEDLSEPKSVAQQISSPPHRGDLGSLLSASLGGLLSEAEKRILPDRSRVATTDLVADDLSPSESPTPPAAASADMAEKDPQSELQGKKSIDPNLLLPKAVDKAEDSPPSSLLLLPQQTPSTLSQEADMPEKQVQVAPLTVIQNSIFPEDMAEKKTYSSDDDDQQKLQGKTCDNVKVKNSSTSTSDSGVVGAVDKASVSSSPLVSIIFKVDSSGLPNLALVSPLPSTTGTPAIEPARLGRSTSGETKVLVRGIPVSSSAASTAEHIFAEHGDVTAKCLLRDEAFRANLVESLVTVVQALEEFPARKLSNDDLVGMQRKLEDLEKVNVNVGWLRERIAAAGPFLDVVESRKRWEEVAAEVGRLGARLEEQEAKLAEQEAKLAEHEGAVLAQKFGEKAEVIETEGGKVVQEQELAARAEVVGTQRSTDNQQGEEEDEVVQRWSLDDLGILCHAFGLGSLFYVLFMSKN